jgi:hypothetical protein
MLFGWLYRFAADDLRDDLTDEQPDTVDGVNSYISRLTLFANALFVYTLSFFNNVSSITACSTCCRKKPWRVGRLMVSPSAPPLLLPLSRGMLVSSDDVASEDSTILSSEHGKEHTLKKQYTPPPKVCLHSRVIVSDDAFWKCSGFPRKWTGNCKFPAKPPRTEGFAWL